MDVIPWAFLIMSSIWYRLLCNLYNPSTPRYIDIRLGLDIQNVLYQHNIFSNVPQTECARYWHYVNTWPVQTISKLGLQLVNEYVD